MKREKEMRKETIFCSFCAKTDAEVRVIFVESTVAMCGEGGDLCVSIRDGLKKPLPGVVEYESWFG